MPAITLPPYDIPQKTNTNNNSYSNSNSNSNNDSISPQEVARVAQYDRTKAWLLAHIKQEQEKWYSRRRQLRALLLQVAKQQQQQYRGENQAEQEHLKGPPPTPQIRLIVGAHDTQYEGWISTNVNDLNVTATGDFLYYFSPPEMGVAEAGEGGSVHIDAVLAEHVWEHLDLVQGLKAARLLHRHMRVGSYIRLAVPDWWAKGIGGQRQLHLRKDIRDGHKVQYNIRLLSAVFQAAGFQVYPLEYHDEQHMLHTAHWESEDGHIQRSARFDRRGAVSLIVDAHKTRC
jgi:predicted SAM-dependent methyltransferase